jgi:hypothetical protein
MFHLDENLLAQTKRQTSFHDLRCLESFFSSLLIPKPVPLTKFQEYVKTLGEKDFDQLCEGMQRVPDKLLVDDFRNRFRKRAEKGVESKIKLNDKVFETALNYKYFAWTAIDQHYRQLVLTDFLKKYPDDKALAIVNTLERLADAKNANKERAVLVNQLQMEFSFSQICESSWRKPVLNMIPEDLRKIWRVLSLREKYDLWYNRFNTRERVRLWNGVVFQIGWFMKVVRKEHNDKSLVVLRREFEKIIKKIKQKHQHFCQEYAQKKNLRSLS